MYEENEGDDEGDVGEEDDFTDEALLRMLNAALNTPICSGCKEPRPEHWKFCPHCGQENEHFDESALIKEWGQNLEQARETCHAEHLEHELEVVANAIENKEDGLIPHRYCLICGARFWRLKEF